MALVLSISHQTPRHHCLCRQPRRSVDISSSSKLSCRSFSCRLLHRRCNFVSVRSQWRVPASQLLLPSFTDPVTSPFPCVGAPGIQLKFHLFKKPLELLVIVRHPRYSSAFRIWTNDFILALNRFESFRPLTKVLKRRFLFSLGFTVPKVLTFAPVPARWATSAMIYVNIVCFSCSSN